MFVGAAPALAPPATPRSRRLFQQPQAQAAQQQGKQGVTSPSAAAVTAAAPDAMPEPLTALPASTPGAACCYFHTCGRHAFSHTFVKLDMHAAGTQAHTPGAAARLVPGVMPGLLVT